ncbi:MAG: Gfo/Idh/MocA family oxidoreductase [Anaerolineae bacterium]|nr:Gfo/Idh/MocA family oxidoreductase [Thermoflexales bacterium]MDW8407987.1 Gfo/Idh/MocA family oxidoreductase [Anaerolineae bacterium]
MTQMASPTVGLSALGGYGQEYLGALLDLHDQRRLRLIGGIDPHPERCSRLNELRARCVPIYPNLTELYREHRPDLLIVSAPIHEHASQTCFGLGHGSHVLCEKPAAATVQEVDQMIAARDNAGKVVAIGSQWSFDPSILRLKQDIMAGRFGRPRRLTSVVLWPRTHSYYTRNTWAGRQRTDNGAWVLDSPVNNATAHYLHNMLFLLGNRLDRSVAPLSVQAELYRANTIENYDTAAMRIWVEGNIEILFYSSHAVKEHIGPTLRAEFEHAVIRMDGLHERLVAYLESGAEIDYGIPHNGVKGKLHAMLEAILYGAPVSCGIEAARAHTICVNGAQECVDDITIFDSSCIEEIDTPEGRLTYVQGLAAALQTCAQAGKLPAEIGFDWACAGCVVNLRGYSAFQKATPDKLRLDNKPFTWHKHPSHLFLTFTR